MTLTDFLLARIAEDETAALLVHNQHGSNPEPMGGYEWMSEYDLLYVPPVRVLAECAAKRAIINGWDAGWSEPDSDYPSRPLGGQGGEVYYDALTYLAAVYADHSDYRHEWRP